jgi:hypothetical protein
MEVVLLKGEKFTEKIVLSSLINQPKDSLFLSSYGFFMLQEKYHTLNSVQFQGQKAIEGHLIAEVLKQKNGGTQLYKSFLFLALTKNLKFMYLDSILVSKEQNEDLKMTIFDKIYG